MDGVVDPIGPQSIMSKRIDQFVTENRQQIERVETNFVDVSSGEGGVDLKFLENRFEVELALTVYRRKIGDTLINGHPDPKYGSGRGGAGDNRELWEEIHYEAFGDTTRFDRIFTDRGRIALRNSLAGDTTGAINQIAIGTNSTTPDSENSSLLDKHSESHAWGEAGSSPNITLASAEFTFDKLPSQINEIGVFSQGNDLYARFATTDAITVADSDEIRIEVGFRFTSTSESGGVITTNGRNLVARSMRSTGEVAGVNKVAFGTDGTDPTVNDTQLGNKVLEKTAHRERSESTLTVGGYVFKGEPSSQPVTLREVGLIGTDGNLIYRVTFNGLEKTSLFEFQTFVKLTVVNG